jgi:hypothetical protein
MVHLMKRRFVDWDDEKKMVVGSKVHPMKEDAGMTAMFKHYQVPGRFGMALPDDDVWVSYMIANLPVMLVVDRQGLVRTSVVGLSPKNSAAVEAAIRDALELPPK